MEQTFRTFGCRYYRWALAAAHREAQSGFKRLQNMHTLSVLEYLDFIRSSPESLSKGIASAFVKQRLFKEFCCDGFEGETLTQVERELLNRYFADLRAPLPEVEHYEDLEENRPELFKINRREMVKKLKRCIQDRGQELQLDSPASGFCTKLIDVWNVRTDFDFGGRFSQFSYWHRIVGPNYYELHGTISLVSWMGIKGGASKWQWCITEELALGIAHAVDACFEFLEAAPGLLDGLPVAGEYPPALRGKRQADASGTT